MNPNKTNSENRLKLRRPEVVKTEIPMPEYKEPGFPWKDVLLPFVIFTPMVVAAFYGAGHIKEQSRRLTKTQEELGSVVKSRDVVRDSLREITIQVARTEEDIQESQRRVTMEALTKAEKEFAVLSAELHRKIDRARRGDLLEDDTVPSTPGTLSTTEELRRKAKSLAFRADELEDQNRQMKAWLNANNKTLHSRF